MFKNPIQKVARLLTKTPLFFHTSLNKVCNTAEEALEGLQAGQKILVGGFGLCGVPENLLRYISYKPNIYNNMWAVSCSCGIGNNGLGVLIKKKILKRITTSYAGENLECEKQYMNGDLALEFFPQGTLAERIRAGAVGVRAFYTPTGVNTYVETGGFPIMYASQGHGKVVKEYSKPKERKVLNGKKCILEEWIRGDFSLIKAWKADTAGNLIMRKTARNFNADMAGASKITVAEVEEIVPAGQIDADLIHVPGIFVDRIFKGPSTEKKIARQVLTTEAGIEYVHSPLEDLSPDELNRRNRIAQRAALELSSGMYVNFGVGVPSMIHRYLPQGVDICILGENGILGIGPYPKPGEEDADLLNAGNETTSALPETSFCNSSTGYGMFRGGHLSAFFIGGLQVSSKGDLANWVIPGRALRGMGAMDSVGAGGKIIVCMTHTTEKGEPKILERCTFPLTGSGIVDTLITDYAVFTFQNQQMILKEVAWDHTLEEVMNKTACEFIIPSEVDTF